MEDKEILKVIEPSPKPIRLFFFGMGIIATIAYRIIIVLNLYSPSWVKIAWYIGTIGFIFYFGHRFNIARKRSSLVRDYKLVEAVDKADCIESQKKLALHYLVKTSLTSKSQWNSGLIFILSFLALLIGIFIDIYSI
ncbi:MAG: hypothetical protein KJI70_00310 [Patescibacteria group bacterium]|nr:hypothetical protein [Patescibacteria group bacterium]